MATLGFLSPEFPPGLAQNLDAMAAAGGVGSQFDLASAVGTTFPDDLSDEQIQAIRDGFIQRRIELSALSGTYNMIDPDPQKRAVGEKSLAKLIAWAPQLGTKIVTLCTGSRDPESMWRRHPDNDKDDAWADLLVQVESAVRTAERHGVVLGVETEVGNCINTVRKARKLLDQIASPHLKIIMDGANIFQKGELPQMRAKIDEAFELLGPDIALAHAKDLDRDGEAGHVPAGLGKLDYPYYLQCMKNSGFTGTIV
jgi:sugar phosphate isomerase/epimerase